MARQRRNSNEELAAAIASLRLATAEREGTIPGSQEYDDALTTEELLNGLVLDLVRQRNRVDRQSRLDLPGSTVALGARRL